MTVELKQWGDEQPCVDRFINLYPVDQDYAEFYKVVQKGFFRGIENSHIKSSGTPNELSTWCYVPAPPDWESARVRQESEAIDAAIAYHREQLEIFEAKKAAP